MRVAPCSITARRASLPPLPRQPNEREAQPLELFADRLDRSELVAGEAPVRQGQRGERAVELDQLDERGRAQRPGQSNAGRVERSPGAASPAACRDRLRIEPSSVAWRARSVRVPRSPRSARQISALTRRSSAARSRSSGTSGGDDRWQPERAPPRADPPTRASSRRPRPRVPSGARAGRARRRFRTPWRADPTRRAFPGSSRAIPDPVRSARCAPARSPRSSRKSASTCQASIRSATGPRRNSTEQRASSRRATAGEPSSMRGARDHQLGASPLFLPAGAGKDRSAARRPERSAERRTVPAAIDAASARTAARGGIDRDAAGRRTIAGCGAPGRVHRRRRRRAASGGSLPCGPHGRPARERSQMAWASLSALQRLAAQARGRSGLRT